MLAMHPVSQTMFLRLEYHCSKATEAKNTATKWQRNIFSCSKRFTFVVEIHAPILSTSNQPVPILVIKRIQIFDAYLWHPDREDAISSSPGFLSPKDD
jgi:hypothetical protein